MTERSDDDSVAGTPPAGGDDGVPDVVGQLREEHERIRTAMAELDVNDEREDYDANFADSAQVAAEQGEARALFQSLQSELADVERALSRLEDGTYGTCEVCAGEIGEARLSVVPSARRCINCA